MRRFALALIVALCTGCSSSNGDDGPRLQLTSGGRAVCSGVRVAPERVLTAAHCGAALSLDGVPLVLEGLVGFDIAAFRAPHGPHYPVASYAGELTLRGYLQSGEHTLRAMSAPREVHESWMYFDGSCRPGDSGAPVFSARGVTALVVEADPPRNYCVVELLK